MWIDLKLTLQKGSIGFSTKIPKPPCEDKINLQFHFYFFDVNLYWLGFAIEFNFHSGLHRLDIRLWQPRIYYFNNKKHWLNHFEMGFGSFGAYDRKFWQPYYYNGYKEKYSKFITDYYNSQVA